MCKIKKEKQNVNNREKIKMEERRNNNNINKMKNNNGNCQQLEMMTIIETLKLNKIVVYQVFLFL